MGGKHGSQEAKKKVMAEFMEEERRRDEALAKQVNICTQQALLPHLDTYYF